MVESVNLEELEKKFREYRRKHKIGPGFRWPEEMKSEIRRAYDLGVPLRRLSIVCQIHTEVVKKWTCINENGDLRFRELVVVDKEHLQERPKLMAYFILPNNIKCELPVEALCPEIVKAFATMHLGVEK